MVSTNLITLCLFLIVGSYCSFAIDTSTCGTSKQCIFSSNGCDPATPSCLVFTYVWNSASSTFNMEISGGSGGDAQYVAVAFSPDGQMANSDLYYCTGNQLLSGAIQDLFQTPRTDSSLPAEITNVVPTTTNGVGECSFTRSASVTKDVSSVPTTFDLSTTPYFVLLATGNFVSGGLVRHSTTNRYRPSSATDFTSTSTAAPPPTTTPALGASDALVGCGTTKGCFRDDGSCIPGNVGCMFASWAYDSDSSTFDFEVIGGSGATSQYAAIAFAVGNQMANADLYYCIPNELRSGSITAPRDRPTVQNGLPPEITNVVVSAENNVLRCTFTRAAVVTKAIQGGNQDFDLENSRYYLLYAVGSHNASGDLLRHSGLSRSLSSEAIDFTEASSSGGSSSNFNLVKAHACFMLIAWLTCASIGVIVARHFKPLWHEQTLFGTKVWFQIHRGLMVTALICTVIGFILIFVFKEGYSEGVGAHPILGIIVTILAIINPTMALFRPHPGEPRRKIFNWAHWFVGSWARILGIVAIFLGVDLSTLDLPEWDTWLLVAFVVVQVVTEVVLEILSAIYGHIPVYKRTKKEEEKIEMDGGGESEPKKDPAPRGAHFKFIILILYTLVNIGILLAFIISIGTFGSN